MGMGAVACITPNSGGRKWCEYGCLHILAKEAQQTYEVGPEEKDKQLQLTDQKDDERDSGLSMRQ